MTITPIHNKLNDFTTKTIKVNQINLHSPIIIIYCGLTCNICGSVSFLKNLTMLPKFSNPVLPVKFIIIPLFPNLFFGELLLLITSLVEFDHSPPNCWQFMLHSKSA